jgi:hypothetical protein
MKNNILIVTLLLLGILSNAQDIDHSKKYTKTLFEVQVNSEKHIIEEGKTIDIDGKLQNPKITVKLMPSKKFNGGNLEFEYPNNYSFEYEESLGYKNWTLDGNDYIIMIFDIDGKMQLEDFVQSMIQQFGKQNCKTKNIETTLGDKKIKGTQIYVELVGEKLIIDFYQYSSSDNNSKFISFQDSLDYQGNLSNEAIMTFKMINESIKYN